MFQRKIPSSGVIKLNYKKSGVSIKKAETWNKLISKKAKDTYTEGVVSGIGGFGGLFRLDTSIYKKPILVSGTDGVGSKLKIAFRYGDCYTVGKDLVAMNVNDILTVGAKPLFFLDYLAINSLENHLLESFIDGVVDACVESGCALIGGETAQLPDFYKPTEFDAAGTAVGVVEEDDIINGKDVVESDTIIGIASSGIHSNGFTLVRKVLKWEEDPQLQKTLLTPTKIYVKTILNVLQEYRNVKAMAHITGGGLRNNILRVIPPHLDIDIQRNNWEIPQIFKLIQGKGKIQEDEMFEVFNMGIGFTLIVPKQDSKKVIRLLEENGEKAWEIGRITRKDA